MSSAETGGMEPWRFKILIDGDCPLCRREASMLRRLDGGRGALAIEDIAGPNFDASCYGVTQADVMGHIHGVMPDGSLVTGMEVFRQAWSAVGWGWLFNWTRWPVARSISDVTYAFFAKHRLRLTGRRDCSTGTCAID